MKAFYSRMHWHALFVLFAFSTSQASAQQTSDYDPELKFSVQQTVVYYFATADELQNDMKVYKAVFQVEPHLVIGTEHYEFTLDSQQVILALVKDNGQRPDPNSLVQPLHYWRVNDVATTCKKLEEMGWRATTEPTNSGAGVIVAVLADQSRRNRIGVLHNPNYPFVKRDSPISPPKSPRKKR
jgi:predicted enzyme related to lactoylglutathione lyase